MEKQTVRPTIIDVGGHLQALWSRKTASEVVARHVMEGKDVNVFHHHASNVKKVSNAVKKYGIMDTEAGLFHERLNRKSLIGKQYLWDIVTYKADRDGNLIEVSRGTVIEMAEHRRSKVWQIVMIGGKKFKTRELSIYYFNNEV